MMMADVERGYDVTLLVDLASVGVDERADVARRVSRLKEHAFSAPFDRALRDHDELAAAAAAARADSGASAGGQLHRMSYRSDEFCYLKAGSDRLTVIFSTRFKEEMDRVFGRVFLQEFVDARRQALISHAPQVLYSIKEAPLELRGLPEQQNADFSYVTFILYPRHFKDPEIRSATIAQVMLFRNYLHYHIKCSKAYIHSRLRIRVSEFLKLLARAKREQQGVAVADKKTVSGRYYRQKKA
ncbi:Actin-related protein 2/3 complex subunit 2 [Smittium culicis]|uniref:Arp2/3 complex 34 kDa subunit n=1 Tax=Smittium culicis TaxID=133412 RepID=A0A1R1YGJ9_9FUNG|nr:Actin-related protein 2/3 complex subunit 2 [Smittium culicis]